MRATSYRQNEAVKSNFGFVFENKFREDSLVLSANQFLPIAANITVNLFYEKEHCQQGLSYVRSCRENVNFFLREQAREGLNELGELLSSNGNCGLAYQVNLWNFYLNDMVSRYNSTFTFEGELGSTLANSCHLFLQKVLNSGELDTGLGVGTMLSLNIEKSFQAYRNSLAHIGHDYKRLRYLSAIGCACGKLWQQRSFAIDCQQLGSNARWWEELKLLNINFDEKLFRQSKDGVYQRKLLPKLLKKTALDLATALLYCDTYNIDRNEALLDYVELIYEERGSCQFIRDNHYKDLIASVVADIRGESFVKLMQSKVINFISPYDFDCLRFTFELLASIGEGKRKFSRQAL